MVALYSKTAGKNGKHQSVSDSSNICAISNAAIQIFEHMHGRQFRSIPEATSTLQTKQFALLPSHSILCLLDIPPKRAGSGLELAQVDSENFKILLRNEILFQTAMKLFRKRGKGSEEDY